MADCSLLSLVGSLFIYFLKRVCYHSLTICQGYLDTELELKIKKVNRSSSVSVIKLIADVIIYCMFFILFFGT